MLALSASFSISAAVIARSRLLLSASSRLMQRAYEGGAWCGKPRLRLRFPSDFPSENCLPRGATRRGRLGVESRGIARLHTCHDTPC